MLRICSITFVILVWENISLIQGNLKVKIPSNDNYHDLHHKKNKQPNYELHIKNNYSQLTKDITVIRYDGAQLWRISVLKEEDEKQIEKLCEKYDTQKWLTIDSQIDVLLEKQILEDATNLLQSANISHIVLIEDLQKVIESENQLLEDIEELQNRKGHRMTWRAYHRANDIHDYLFYVAETYPNLCSVEIIGFSVEDRPIVLLKISNKKRGNGRIWIDGGMHSREWISPASVTFVIEKLTQEWESMPNYIKNIDWYILPLVNPDGYEYTHVRDRLWRKNRAIPRGNGCVGVDLNRNFGFKWGGKGTSSNSCSDIYRGSNPFSEPETTAISNYMSKFGKCFFDAYITVHSYGQYILYPWGHEAFLPSDHEELNRIAKEAAANILKESGATYSVGSSAITLYPAAGGSDDWAKGILKIKYSYTLEMRDNGRYGFILPAKYIEKCGFETMTFLQTLAKTIEAKYI